MTETYLSDATLNALSGTTDSEQEVVYPSIYEAPYYTTFYKMLHRLLNVARRAGDLRVFQDGSLTFGVRAGAFINNDLVISYAEAAEQSLTDNATNYLYLTAAGVLTKNTTGFPVPSVSPHIRLAEIVTASGAITSVTDKRSTALWQILGSAAGSLNSLDWQESVLDEVDFTAAEPGSPTLGDRYINTVTGTSNVTAQSVTINYIYEWNGTSWTEIVPTEGAVSLVEDIDMLKGWNGSSWVSIGTFALLNEAQTFFAATDISGAEAETLTDTSNADALHGHAHSATTGQGTDDHHAQSHSVASHSDTTATGAELETLTDGSTADSLHVHDSPGIVAGAIDNAHLAGLITEDKMAVAATQTISASNGTITHNNKRSVRITLSGATQIYTFGDTSNPQAIDDGTVIGQMLTILVVDSGTFSKLVIRDLVSPAKTNLRGDWASGLTESSTEGSTYLNVQWDGSVWQEVERYDGFGWESSGSLSHAEGINTIASEATAHAEGNTTTASAVASHAEGFGSTASGDNSHAEGNTTTASGNDSHARGTDTVASGVGSSAIGQESSATLLNQVAHGSGMFNAVGDAQSSELIARRAVTHSDANWYDLLLDGSGATVLPDILADTVWTFEVQIVGTTQGCTKSFGFLINGVIENDGGTTTLLASNVTTLYDTDDTDFDVRALADDTNDSLLIQVSDSTLGGDVVRWVTTIKHTAVNFPA